MLKRLLAILLVSGLFTAAYADSIISTNVQMTPYVYAGSPAGENPPGTNPDSLALRTDTIGAFTQSVSISIQNSLGGFICSGTLLDSQYVLTAAHCVDATDGSGAELDLNDPTNRVLVVFNDDGPFTNDPTNDIVLVDQVNIAPGYNGFGTCGTPGTGGFTTQCLGDDIAVLHLSQPAPASAPFAQLFLGEVVAGDRLVFAGYGTRGDGFNGTTAGPDFASYLIGSNVVDIFDCDDESAGGGRSGGFGSSSACSALGLGGAETWYADFDGFDRFFRDANGDLINGGIIDSFCLGFGICSTILPNTNNLAAGIVGESNIGGGDSGGGAYICRGSNLATDCYLAGNTTFGSVGGGPFGITGAFGNTLGGNLLRPYLPFLSQFVSVPEPGTISLFALGLASLALGRRRKGDITREG